jgi:nicotinamidase-related amidase
MARRRIKNTRQARRPSRSASALLILDLISEFRFVDWRRVLAAATTIAPRVARLAARARSTGVAVIYVNDTGGQWESDQAAFIRRCVAPGARGREVVNRIKPEPEDYFIFKLRHSGFYGTPLPQLLEKLGARELILTGLTTHQCVLFTAMDAYVRDYRLVVPRDCIGAPSATASRHGLFVLEHALMARTALSTSLRL